MAFDTGQSHFVLLAPSQALADTTDASVWVLIVLSVGPVLVMASSQSCLLARCQRRPGGVGETRAAALFPCARCQVGPLVATQVYPPRSPLRQSFVATTITPFPQVMSPSVRRADLGPCPSPVRGNFCPENFRGKHSATIIKSSGGNPPSPL